MRTPQGTGWLARQEAAKAALQTRFHPIADDPVSQARRAMLDDQEAAARAHREAREAAIRETACSCPTCDGVGHVLVSEAAAVVEAIERYHRVGHKPDAATIGRLMARAFEIDRAGNRILAAAVQSDPAKPIAKATKKPAPPPPPWLDTDAILED